MNINKIGNSVQFTDDKKMCVFPVGQIILIANDESNTINVRLKASRKNVLTFNYQDITNIEASSATEAVETLSQIIN